jgi:hypothetical protein
MPTYKIPVLYSMWGTVKVDAKDLRTAVDKVLSGDTCLPEDADYVDDSEQIDWDSVQHVDGEDPLTEGDLKFLKQHTREE